MGTVFNDIEFIEPDRSSQSYKTRHTTQEMNVGARYSQIGLGAHPSNVDTFDLTCGLNQEFCRLENRGSNDLERPPPPMWHSQASQTPHGHFRTPSLVYAPANQVHNGYSGQNMGYGPTHQHDGYQGPFGRPSFDLMCGDNGEFCQGKQHERSATARRPLPDTRTFGHQGWMTLTSYSRTSDSDGPVIRTATFPKPMEYGWRPSPMRRGGDSVDTDYTDDFPLISGGTDPDKLLDLMTGAMGYQELYGKGPLQRKSFWPDDSPMYYGHGPSMPTGHFVNQRGPSQQYMGGQDNLDSGISSSMYFGQHQLDRPSNGLAGPQCL